MGLGLKGENNFDGIIATEIERAGGVVPLALVKGLISVESQFKPTAYRAEPAIGDASRGLMQILFRTAQGVGYTGTAEGLFDPATNIRYGVAYLSGQVRRFNGDLLRAVSAYNNGSGKIATQATRFCLARDKAGKCIRYYTAQPGEFYNQPYVDKVASAWHAYGGPLPTNGPAGRGSVFSLLLLAGVSWWILTQLRP